MNTKARNLKGACASWLLFLGLPVVSHAQFSFTTNNGSITITGYSGPGGALNIPPVITGLPVTSIGTNVFQYAQITSVSIPNSVTSIGDQAFWECGVLTNIIIPRSVTNIGDKVFELCTSLTAVTVDQQNLFYVSLEGVLFNKSQTTILQYPNGLGGGYTIPDSVTSIGPSAFSFCTGLMSITIPASVTSIESFGFYYCDALTNVSIVNGLVNIGYLGFADCTSLVSVTIPTSVTNLGESAFSFCFSLEGLYFEGNPPSFITPVFFEDNNPIVYYLPGTTSWGPRFAGAPTVLWNATIQANGASFGVSNNQFGFDITATNNVPVVVEATTNLVNPFWIPLQTITLTNGLFHFAEPFQTNNPSRFYRLSPP